MRILINNNQYIIKIGYSITLLLLLIPAAYAKISPDNFVKELSSELLQELDMHGDKIKNNNSLAHSIAKRVVLPRIDVIGMSRSVLGRKVWNTMSSGQQEEFTVTFTDLIVKTYSKSLKGYNNDEIKVFPVHKRYLGRNRVVIKSLLIRKRGQKIKLKYRMIAKGGSWKIYDFSVSGISLLQNFRTQFTRELSRGSLDDLIDKMKKR